MAQEICHRILAVDPTDLGANSLLGLCFAESGRMDEARSLIEGAASAEPRTWRFLLNLSVLREIEGRIDPQPEAADEHWFVGGRSDSFANFEGKMAEVSLYDRALSPDEVTAHYQAAAIPAAVSPR